jgi:4'-phosphopantetheinyl transferase
MAAIPSETYALWSKAPSTLSFPAHGVDIWKLCLNEPPASPSENNVLSPDERARASRFHFEPDRITFVRCRSVLRSLLSTYLAIPAADLAFEYLANGKPQLVATQNPRALHFNVSHSANTALIAVGSRCQLGIDIEKIHDDVDTTSLAERFFSPRECAGLLALPPHLRVCGFYSCWTRKEAFLKATGTGLSFPLSDFSVTTHPDLNPELEEILGDAEARRQWFFTDLNVGHGYRATVALDRPHRYLRTYSWTDLAFGPSE